eukprot:g20982.t1
MKVDLSTDYGALYAAIQARKPVVCFADQDRTVSRPLGRHVYQEKLALDEALPGILMKFASLPQGRFYYIPSSARSIEQLQDVYAPMGIEYAKSGNDGGVIELNGEVVYFDNTKKPDFTQFDKKFREFAANLDDVAANDMDLYYQALVDFDSPHRAAVEAFVEAQFRDLEANCGVVLVLKTMPDGFSIEPRYNRGKDGAINFMLARMNLKDVHVLVCGDSTNDVKAAGLAKEMGGTAIWVNKDGKNEVPSFATHAVSNVGGLMAVLNGIADEMAAV